MFVNNQSLSGVPVQTPEPFLLSQMVQGTGPDLCKKDKKAVQKILKNFYKQFGPRFQELLKNVPSIELIAKQGGIPTSNIEEVAKEAIKLADEIFAYMTQERLKCGNCNDCYKITKMAFEDIIQTVSSVRVYADDILDRISQFTDKSVNFLNSHKAEIAVTVGALLALKKLVGILLLPTPAAPLGGGLLVTP